MLERLERLLRNRQTRRYLAVSLLNVANHQILLWLANSVWGWSGGWANTFAASVSAVPAYWLSRHWVWEVDRGQRHSWRAEILPFWTLALLGLVVSSTMAELADNYAGAGIWVNLASLAGYFGVWVAKFVLLDLIFSRSRNGTPADAVA